MFGTDELETYGSIGAIVVGMIAILLSGIFFGVVYYSMTMVHEQLLKVDCDISDNIYFETCQDMFMLSIYPFLALRSILVWGSYFFIFGTILGLLVLAYKSGNSPWMMGVFIVSIIGITYLAIIISNIFGILIENPMFITIMEDFSVYNWIMYNFPWIMFFVSLISIILMIVNHQRTPIASQEVFDF